jgi:hypothetical protein
MAHCTPGVQSEWVALLASLGVDVDEPISERHSSARQLQWAAGAERDF